MIMNVNAHQQQEKASVFISYAREDAKFVRVLLKTIQEHGVETKGD
jgi:hypothetical protein